MKITLEIEYILSGGIASEDEVFRSISVNLPTYMAVVDIDEGGHIDDLEIKKINLLRGGWIWEK